MIVTALELGYHHIDVLRWHLDLDLVASPKSSNASRLRENLDIVEIGRASCRERVF